MNAIKLVLILFTLSMCPSLLFADARRMLDKPFMIGPQYPLMFLSTTFEPDTAFTLNSGDTFFATSYSLLNSFVYSSNSKKADDASQPASEFYKTQSTGYSVYFDGEMDHRFFKFYYGLSDSLELQFSYQDFRFSPGSLDDSIESFHETLGIDNQGRHRTEQDLLEIYIYDNEIEENVFVLSEGMSAFKQQSMTLGLKFLVRKTEQEAISFSLSSNFGDYYIEQELNDATSDAEDREFRQFNDSNISLRYSSLFSTWSLHAAVSISYVRESLLKKSPNAIYYFFLGANWHISENWDYILQALEYTSPFPKDKSTIGEDIREMTTGLRWFVTENSAWELGFTENQTQGPQNIDIVFFTNLMLYL